MYSKKVADLPRGLILYLQLQFEKVKTDATR